MAIEASGDVVVGLACEGGGVGEDEGFASVGGDDDLFVVGDGANVGDREDFFDVIDGHHLTGFDHGGSDAVDDQVDFFDAVGFEEADDAIGVADGGDLRGGDDQGFGGGGDRVAKSHFNSGGAVDQNIVVAGAQGADQLFHLLGVDGFFGPVLGGGEEGEFGLAFVFDEGLIEAALSGEDVEGGVDDSIFEAEE